MSILIDNKLSVEYILELSNNFELLKRKVLTEEEYEQFDKLPYFKLEEQMREFKFKI